MIDLSKLETFLCVNEYLSISEAARQLHLSQPTVSHHIKVLERELGVDLFDRTGAGLHLTEAGRLLLPWARKIIHDSIEMQEMVSSLQDGIVGHLRIACSTTAGKYVLPQLAARFCKRYPGVRVSILACMPENVVTRLLGGEANLGVVSYETRQSEMEYQEFFNDHIGLIVSSNHAWITGRAIEPGELIGEPLIIREPTSGTRRVMLSELAKHDISLEDLNIFLELGNAEAIVRTVASGYGISFVSNLASACPLERGNVINVRVKGLNLQRKIFMVRRRLDPANRPTDAFWGFVHDPSNLDLIHLAEAHFFDEE